MRTDFAFGNGEGILTAAAGTPIRRLLPPVPNGTTRLMRLAYAAGLTAHTLTALRPIGRTSFTAAAAAGGIVVTVARDPGPTGNPLAANDLLAIRETDGITRLYTVQSVSALAVTLTTALVAGESATSGTMWNFGILSDTDPVIGTAHPTWTLPASATTTYADDTAGVVAGHVRDSPVLLSIDNVTNAGTLRQTVVSYTRDHGVM